VAEGWIKLHRKIRDNPLFKENRKFSKFEAWIDLLLAANHADNEVVFGYEKIQVKRGQLITSEVQLADRWKWNRLSVRRFLTYLMREQMVSKIATSKYTILTIENYDFYQSGYTAEATSNEHQTNIKRTSNEHQSNTNKNDKNDKNDKNKKNNIFIPPTLEEVRAYCLERGNGVDPEKWYAFYEAKGWMIGKNKMKDWRAAVRTWEKNSKPKKRNYDDWGELDA